MKTDCYSVFNNMVSANYFSKEFSANKHIKYQEPLNDFLNKKAV